jgi:ferrochelatase
MSTAKRIGVLLVNLGTPDSPKTADVRKYLQEFLMDKRVIDIPYAQRALLINGIIAPFRAPKSAHAYSKIWTEKGSPLMFYGVELKDLVQKALGDHYIVHLAMRYQNPSIASVLSNFEGKAIEKIIVIPLFPQYASASTGSAQEEVMRVLSQWQVIPTVNFVGKFFEEPLFIKAFAELGRKYLERRSYDHIIFSYHGLPERQIVKASVDNQCQLGDCCKKYHSRNAYCYRAQSYETTRLLVKELNIPEGKYSVGFQSRLGKTPWIKPYTDDVIKQLGKEGKKSILFFSPSFIADCLETIEEGGVEYKELFEKHGGQHWQLVESLNTSDTWVECLREMVLKNS